MNSGKHKLSPALIESVLDKLGFSDVPTVDLAGLASLYDGWCRSVPFDNLCKRIFLAGTDPVFPGTDDMLFFANWLRFGTGGTCWSGNGALQTLLVSLGFAASRRRGTMLVGRDDSPNHGSVTVAIDQETYLVDASMLHGAPLLLDPDHETAIAHGAWGLCNRTAGDNWLVHWRPLHLPDGVFCRIERGEIDALEWLQRNDRSRLISPFNDALYARKNIGDCVVGVEYGAQTTFYPDGSVTRQKCTHRQLLDFLETRLGYAPQLLVRLPP